jgi:hypothetical protein
MYDRKVNMRLRGKEYTLYFNERLQTDVGACTDCGRNTPVERYWTKIVIKEIVNEAGNKVNAHGKLAEQAIEKLYRANRSESRRCGRHYLRFYRAIPLTIS